MDDMDTSLRFSASMNTLGKRLEVIRIKNDLSLMQNEVLQLRELEMLEAEAKETSQVLARHTLRQKGTRNI